MNKFFNYSLKVDEFLNDSFEIFFICKSCGKKPLTQLDGSNDIDYWCLTPYCPFCGEKMFDHNDFILVPTIYEETKEYMFEEFKQDVVYEEIWKPVLDFVDNYRKNNCAWRFDVYTDSFVGIDNSLYTANLVKDDRNIFYCKYENQNDMMKELNSKNLEYSKVRYYYDRKTFWK